MLRCLFLLLLLRPDFSRTFDAGFLELGTVRQADRDTTHYAITVCALCRVTIDYIKSAYKIDTTQLERRFNVTNGQCQGKIVNDIITILKNSPGVNPWQFATTIKTIATSNTKVDLKEMFKEQSHFDSETLLDGSKLVMKRYQATLDSISKADNYDQARRTFGEMLHTVQDFYSHTNFIELEHTSPSDVLGQRIFREDEYASNGMRTCISCRGQDCQTKPNLDENLQKKKLLTSGYFIARGLSILKKKPKGKCSHGGTFDGSQDSEPTGGINKDTLGAVHGHLHYRAANMGYRATVKILTQLRKDIGDDAFGMFLTLKKNLNSLIISIDTECSIADYVELAKSISINIVKQYGGLEFAPHNYILTSFSSEKAELLVHSRQPKDLTDAIDKLNSCQRKNSTSIGNMYYHSLIEGLKQCEYASVIYTFTDSPAKDADLKHHAHALLRSKRAVIYSFMGHQMKTRMFKTQLDLLDGSDNDTDLATISGGLTYPIFDTEQSVISEFILRRLEWTTLQSIFMFKSRSASVVFYVDSSIRELHIDISSMGEITNINQIELLRPDNTLHPLTLSFDNTKHLYMWKILQPSFGAWHLKTPNLSDGFYHNVQIQGKTSYVCSSTLQKEMKPNTDSSGYTQLTSEPIINSDLLVLTTCENLLVTNVNISLVDQSGSIIASYSPTESNELGTLTKIRIPQKQFRIQTIVTLDNMNKIQRIEKQLISPTIFSIELTNQPYIVSVDETIQMNYTIKSAIPGQVTVRLQIFDTLKLIDSDGIDKDITFTDEISGTKTLTLPKTYQQKLTTDVVIFAVSSQNNQTKKSVYENDEFVSVYLEVNSASFATTINYFITAILLAVYQMRS